MRNFSALIWIEARKAWRSRMRWGTLLGALFMPVGIAFLIFVARNPEISQKLGLIGAKANLLAYANTDWSAYLGLTGLILAAGGFILYVLIVSWVFGREFTDGTLKDMLAVPVRRGSILLAKMSVAAIWSAVISLEILAASLAMGVLIQLPGGSPAVIAQGSALVAITALLEIGVALPFAFFASVGRGYLLPFGVAMLTLLITNLEALAGFGEYFPWAIPGLFAQAKTPLPALSFWLVPITGLAGLLVTYVWWKFADQNK
jgi:ABC-2 type transport system permease protein